MSLNADGHSAEEDKQVLVGDNMFLTVESVDLKSETP
jgi:hypothetical protein